MKKIIITIIIVAYFVNLSFAQIAEINSLKNIINTTKDDSVKLITYLLLSDKIKFEHPDSNRQVYNDAINFAKKKNHKMTIAGLYNNRAISYGVYEQNDSSINYFRRAIKLYTEIDSSLPQLGYAYNNISLVYSNIGYFNLAIKYQLKAVKFSESINDTAKIASHMNNLAATFHDMDEPKKALVYALQASDMYNKLPDSYDKVNNLIALEDINSELNLQDTALYFNKKVVKLALKLKYMRALPDIYNNTGYIYEKQGKYDKAKQNLFLSLNYCDSLKNENYKFFPFWHLASVYRKEKDFTKAKKYIDKILEFADNQDNNSYKTKAYKETYKYFKATSDLKNALKYFELYKQWSDTMLNTKKYKQISEMNIIYETEKKEQKIKLQEKENTIQKAELKQQKIMIWLIVFVSVLIFILIVAYIIYRSQKQKQEILKLQVEAQDYTKKEISSELHTGIGSELTAVILQLENKYGNTKETESIKKIYRNIRKASHILSLPDFIVSTIEDEINNLVSNFKTDNLEIEAGIFSKTGWKNISPIIQQNIYRIVQELFTNSMKHAQASRIEVQLVRHKDFINLSYEDNGKGYNPQEIISSKGYQDEIIARTKVLKGTFTDDSKIGEGTVLTFKFPV